MLYKNILKTVMVFFISSLTIGCYKDILKPPNPNAPAQSVSFSADLVPLFSSNCALSGCHTSVAPILTPDAAYSSLTEGGFVNTANPSNSTLYLEVRPGGGMPPGGSLSSDKVQKIFDWIRNGAPNN